jgi:hypothetical protein
VTWHIHRVTGTGYHERVLEFDTEDRGLAEHHKRNGATVTPDDLGELGPYVRHLGPYTVERLDALSRAAGRR